MDLRRAKSDIIVTGAASQRKNIISEFEFEKRVALKLKAERDSRIELFKPTLEKLVKQGLVNGVIGRGSYFDANGYPRKGNDIDLIFLVKEMTDEKKQHRDKPKKPEKKQFGKTCKRVCGIAAKERHAPKNADLQTAQLTVLWRIFLYIAYLN